MQRNDYLERARTGRTLANAYGLAHNSTRITPAPQQAVKLCACGRPATIVDERNARYLCAACALKERGQ
jgi:hypothetical protein